MAKFKIYHLHNVTRGRAPVLHLTSSDLNQTKMQSVVIPVCEDSDIHDAPAILNLISNARKYQEFTGKKDQELIIYDPPDTHFDRIILTGLGKLKQINPDTLRSITGKAVKKFIQKQISQTLIIVPDETLIHIDTSLLLEAMLEGAFLGNQLFDLYKTTKKYSPLQSIHFWMKPELVKKYRRLPLKVESVCQCTALARQWVSTPSNHKRPSDFTKAMVSAAGTEPISVTVLDEAQLNDKGFGAILAVSAGSQSPPNMLVLDYNPEGAGQTIALVGKGVTFDSGGINLKPAASLEDMKMDMAGAATVAAAVIAASRLKYPNRIIGIMPVVENMPSANATRPGDIIRTYEGKTVEIGNTDAEGRLILIDAMAYAVKLYTPDILIDVATLTGACVVALGEKIAGVFSFDDELAEALIRSGEKTHERCWRMPLPEDYKELLKSEFADISNISSSKWGGAITAALFLSEFVGDTRWAHMDIAGPAYVKKETDYCGAGGTGFGVRLLCDLLEKLPSAH